MLPILFYVGSLPVGTHDFFVLLGVVAATIVFFYEARRRQMLDDRLVLIAVGALLFGAVGAKLSTAWEYVVLAPEPTLLGIIQRGGKSILGGLAGAYLGAVVTKRLVGYRERTGDLFAPGVALGMAIGRWGCFLTEQLGTPTALPWGIPLSPELAARVPCAYCIAGTRMHPSFLYEIIFQAAMFGLLWWLRPRVFVSGELLKIYLLGYALFRFAVEFVRGNAVVWEGLTRSQLFLIPSTALLIWYFVRQVRRDVYRLPRLEPAPGAERSSVG